VVVSVKHAIFGKVILAVVKGFQQCRSQDIISHVVDKLGESHRLAAVLSLEQIGFVDLPRNKSGKVSKLEIEAAATLRVS
jgi:acyl-coenzyme A synthetase/AMP-(fatty) acid ligase